MTDETYEAIIKHVRQHTIRPCSMLPQGMGVSALVDERCEPDEPRFEGGFIFIHPDDWEELVERVPTVQPGE